jgi:hypothetical protein
MTMTKTIFSTLLLLSVTAAAQAATPDCNPAQGNWINAAPTTCRFKSPGNEKPDSREYAIKIDIPEYEDDIPR